MLFRIHIFIHFVKGDIVSLVLFDFVVGLEQLVLDADFLDVEVGVDVDVFELELKGKAALDQVAGVEDS